MHGDIYRRRVEAREQPGVGHGVLWEGNLVYQHIYNAATRNERFIPVLLDGAKFEHIPTPLQGVTHYRPETDDGYEALYRRITEQPRIAKPPRGTLKTLPPDTAPQTHKPAPSESRSTGPLTSTTERRASHWNVWFIAVGYIAVIGVALFAYYAFEEPLEATSF